MTNPKSNELNSALAGIAEFEGKKFDRQLDAAIFILNWFTDHKEVIRASLERYLRQVGENNEAKP